MNEQIKYSRLTRFVAAGYYFFDLGELLIFREKNMSDLEQTFVKFHLNESLKLLPFLLVGGLGLFFGLAPNEFNFVSRDLARNAGFIFLVVYVLFAIRGMRCAWKGNMKKIYDFS
ncbi:hypothetical protein H6758_02820 [Candidatus Nomurabacteria bacterium]|nr:hypothetical protein [Candidatus Nomurabacteria bacterium]